MRMMHISQNRYEWSSRRVLELQKEITKLENKMANEKSFFKRFSLKRKLSKLIKSQNRHGQEVLEYEQLHNN